MKPTRSVASSVVALLALGGTALAERFAQALLLQQYIGDTISPRLIIGQSIDVRADSVEHGQCIGELAQCPSTLCRAAPMINR